jgi:hypothetical protein
MNYDLEDPEAPPEPGAATLKAKDLKGHPLLIRPTGMGEWPARPEGVDENGQSRKARGPQPYVECEIWTLDRMGIVEHSTGVRVSWWRCVAQLQEKIGHLIAARPVEQDDRSVILERLSGPAKEAAEKAVAELRSQPAESVGLQEGPVTSYEEDYSEEPF